MQAEEKRLNSSLVYTLKDGRKKVTKKSLIAKYGGDKLAVVAQTIKHPSVLDKYREAKRNQFPAPIDHVSLAEIESTTPPNFKKLLEKLALVLAGKEQAAAYENVVEEVLSALFYPALTSPTKQHKIHQNRKRIDLIYVNSANSGFFNWLSLHYPSGHIFIECKNYTEDVKNPEIDQLSSRFSPSRGRVGFLISRKISNRPLLMQRCLDTAKDDRGFIIPLDDDDLKKLVHDSETIENPMMFPHLKKMFNELIM